MRDTAGMLPRDLQPCQLHQAKEPAKILLGLFKEKCEVCKCDRRWCKQRHSWERANVAWFNGRGHSYIRRLHCYVLSGHRSFTLNYFDILIRLFSAVAIISRLRQFTTTGRQTGLTGSSVILQTGGRYLNSPHVQPVALAREIFTICQLLHILRLNYNLLVDEVNREFLLSLHLLSQTNIFRP